MQPHPELLMIVTERVRPGAEEAYGRVESEIAELCARSHCPNPYLALETIRGPKDVWWINSFMSDADKDRVEQAYADNEPLATGLLRLSRIKESLTFEPVTVLARYRADLSGGAQWRVAGARYFAAALGHDWLGGDGVVFEAPDGQRYGFAAAATLAEAARVGARIGPASTILAVQPSWSFPAADWVAADPDFWRAHP